MDHKVESNPGLALTHIIDLFRPLLQKRKTFSFRRVILEKERFLLFFRRDSWTLNRIYNDPLMHLPENGSRKASETQTPMKSQGRALFLATNSSHLCFLLYSHWRQLQRPPLIHPSSPLSYNSLRGFGQRLRKKLQTGSSTRSAVMCGPWGDLVRSCLDRLFQICWVSEHNEIWERRMAVQGRRAPYNLLSLGGGRACSFPAFMDTFPPVVIKHVWSPTGRYCFPLFHFQPLLQSVTKHEIQFIEIKLLGLIILLGLTFLRLLGQNASTQMPSHNWWSWTSSLLL